MSLHRLSRREDEKNSNFWKNQANFLEQAIRQHVQRHNSATDKAFLIIAETVQKEKRQKCNFSKWQKRIIAKAQTKDTQAFITDLFKLDSKFNGPYKIIAVPSVHLDGWKEQTF